QISHHIIKIRQIKKEGSIQSRELDIDYTNKSSLWFYLRLFSYIMLVAITLFLVSFLTTSIFEYIYYDEINYFIPIIAMFFVGTNNGCKQIERHIDNH
ncbi:MAG: hypothetical protein IJX26_01925, partial [Clostridia bacterium]|nr:hypothetical protein [Clostridia bacterium]